MRAHLLLAGLTLLLVASAPVGSLEWVVDLPEQYGATRLAGNAAWLDDVDPALGDWVVEAAAVRPPGIPQRGGGVALAHGVRFDTAEHARAAWSAIRAADGTRYDVEGFGDVHAHRKPLLAGTALVDYFRLVDTDIFVVSVRIDGNEEVSDHARDVLSWHQARTDGSGLPWRPALAVTALIGLAALIVWRRG